MDRSSSAGTDLRYEVTQGEDIVGEIGSDSIAATQPDTSGLDDASILASLREQRLTTPLMLAVVCALTPGVGAAWLRDERLAAELLALAQAELEPLAASCGYRAVVYPSGEAYWCRDASSVSSTITRLVGGGSSTFA